jgi:hypothetical protein
MKTLLALALIGVTVGSAEAQYYQLPQPVPLTPPPVYRPPPVYQAPPVYRAPPLPLPQQQQMTPYQTQKLWQNRQPTGGI